MKTLKILFSLTTHSDPWNHSLGFYFVTFGTSRLLEAHASSSMDLGAMHGGRSWVPLSHPLHWMGLNTTQLHVVSDSDSA